MSERDDLIRLLSRDPARYWGVTIGVHLERLDDFWRDVVDVVSEHIDAVADLAYRRGFDDASSDHRSHGCCGLTSPPPSPHFRMTRDGRLEQVEP